MKNSFNTIEEHNSSYREQLIETWETEARLYRNWLDGHRSRAMVGFLADRYGMTEEYAKERLAYANKILNNIDHYVQRNSYNYKKPEAKKDNDLSFVGKGKGWANSSVIRVPSLKRKTAWKRFYKMFPDLKGMKTIPGKSSSGSYDSNGNWYQNIQHESTIKLKKIKK